MKSLTSASGQPLLQENISVQFPFRLYIIYIYIIYVYVCERGYVCIYVLSYSVPKYIKVVFSPLNLLDAYYRFRIFLFRVGFIYLLFIHSRQTPTDVYEILSGFHLYVTSDVKRSPMYVQYNMSVKSKNKKLVVSELYFFLLPIYYLRVYT